MGTATPIEPQSIDFSPSHQSMLDQVEQAAKGLWNWFESVLPDHPQKADALNAVKAAYDNAATVVRQVAEKEFADAKAQAQSAGTELVENAEAAGEAVVSGVEQAAAGVVGSVTPTAAASAGEAGTGTSATSSNAASTQTSGSTDTPTK